MQGANSATQLEAAIEQRTPPLSPAIAASWRRSFANGVDPDADKLPPLTEEDEAAARSSIEGGIDYVRGFYIDYLKSLWEMIDAWGGVVLFTDHSLRICSIRGNEHLLSLLSERNVAFGTDLSERNAGTNAITMARDTMSGCRLDPSENYCKVFRDCICIAQGPIKIGIDDFILVMAVIPLQNFSEERARAAEYSLRGFVLMGRRGDTPDATASKQLLDTLVSHEGASYIIVNENEQIVDIGSTFLSSLHVQRGKTIGTRLRKTIPSLAPVLDACAVRDESDPLCDVRGLQISGEPAWARAFTMNIDKKRFIAIVVHADSLQYRDNGTKGSADPFAKLTGESSIMHDLRNRIRKLAMHERDVLIIGEIGTGKGTSALAIHNLSNRKSGPFVSCSCALLSGENAEGRLLGIDQNRQGLLERARGGTLFLSGIEALSAQAQSLLANIIDTGTVTRIGDLNTVRCDVRLMMTSGHSATTLLEEGLVKPDFYYRLPTAILKTPALRDHAEDIPTIAASLACHASGRSALSNDQPLPALDSKALGALPWKGNVRELKRIVEQALFEEDAARFMTETIDQQLQYSARPKETSSSDRSETTPSEELSYEAYERNLIIDALRRYRGNKTAAAKDLGISRQKLYARIDAYNLH